MSGRSAAALVLAAALMAAPAPAHAAQRGVFLEVNPNTIQAGLQVGVRASCGENLNPATVRSDAFGEITLTPQQGSPVLTGSATVPPDTRPGDYQVELRCADGDTATAELYVLDMARPTNGPATGGGGTAGDGGAAAVAAPVLLAAGGVAALGAAASLLLTARRRAP